MCTEPGYRRGVSSWPSSRHASGRNLYSGALVKMPNKGIFGMTRKGVLSDSSEREQCPSRAVRRLWNVRCCGGITGRKNKQGGQSRPVLPPKSTLLTPKLNLLSQATPIRNKIVDRVALVRGNLFFGIPMFPQPDDQRHDDHSGQKCSNAPKFHTMPFVSMDADKALRFPQFQEYDRVPGLLLHLMEKNALHEQSLLAGKRLELISAFHAQIS
mgnify:CR=1 FL=1